MRAKTDEFKVRLANGRTLDDILTEALHCREASKRVLGQRPYDVQLIGGIAYTSENREMKKRRRKKRGATFGYLNALAGRCSLVRMMITLPDEMPLDGGILRRSD